MHVNGMWNEILFSDEMTPYEKCLTRSGIELYKKKVSDSVAERAGQVSLGREKLQKIKN